MKRRLISVDEGGSLICCKNLNVSMFACERSEMYSALYVIDYLPIHVKRIKN